MLLKEKKRMNFYFLEEVIIIKDRIYFFKLNGILLLKLYSLSMFIYHLFNVNSAISRRKFLKNKKKTLTLTTTT